jgi:putative glycerol-1-phosphate prenyltransferase
MTIFDNIKTTINEKGAAYFILIDPDKLSLEKAEFFVHYCEKAGVDGFLIGGSLMIDGDLDLSIQTIKKFSDLPVIIFPGSVNQVSKYADAILFISLISGRNAEHLIGKHVHAAPLIKKYNLEVISTGYILVESGKTTTAEYISASKPVPRNKPEIAAATALAGEYLGMKLVYLEGGSGAENSVPKEMIQEVARNVTIPIVVGGGIKSPSDANEKVRAGAKIIITGNHFENENNWELIPEFSAAIHLKQTIEI